MVAIYFQLRGFSRTCWILGLGPFVELAGSNSGVWGMSRGLRIQLQGFLRFWVFQVAGFGNCFCLFLYTVRANSVATRVLGI